MKLISITATALLLVSCSIRPYSVKTKANINQQKIAVIFGNGLDVENEIDYVFLENIKYGSINKQKVINLFDAAFKDNGINITIYPEKISNSDFKITDTIQYKGALLVFGKKIIIEEIIPSQSLFSNNEKYLLKIIKVSASDKPHIVGNYVVMNMMEADIWFEYYIWNYEKNISNSYGGYECSETYYTSTPKQFSEILKGCINKFKNDLL